MNINILVFTLALFLVIECKTVPDYIKVCKKSDPKINDCIIKSIYDLLPKLREGIPELQIPSIDPLHIKNVEIISGTQAVNIDMVVKDLFVYNTSVFEILNLEYDIEKDFIQLKTIIPDLHGRGNYEGETKVLALHVKGKGAFSFDIKEYGLTGAIHGKRIVVDGKEYYKCEKMHFNITIGSAKLNVENLFHGNGNLGKATNDVINDNIEGFFDLFKPHLEDGLEDIFTDIANKITLNFELKDLFPD